MCSKYELIYHKELNMFNWHCGYFGLFHYCTRKIKGTINIVSCPNGCSFCEKELERKEYNSFRWKVNEDVYSICGTCFDKLSDRPICENCFCASCYSSIDEKFACFNLLEKKVSSNRSTFFGVWIFKRFRLNWSTCSLKRMELCCKNS